MFSIIFVVIIAFLTPWQPSSARCENSHFITGDIITTPKGRSAIITRIAAVSNEANLIKGWVYDTNLGIRLLEATRSMKSEDRDRSHVAITNGDKISGLVQIGRTGNPWTDLHIHYCTAGEMQLAKYAPWRRPL